MIEILLAEQVSTPHFVLVDSRNYVEFVARRLRFGYLSWLAGLGWALLVKVFDTFQATFQAIWPTGKTSAEQDLEAYSRLCCHWVEWN